MEEQFKIVARFNDLMSAEILASQLRANGIAAAVFNESSSFPSISEISGVYVKVNTNDYDEAIKLLASSDSAE